MKHANSTRRVIELEALAVNDVYGSNVVYIIGGSKFSLADLFGPFEISPELHFLLCKLTFGGTSRARVCGILT